MTQKIPQFAVTRTIRMKDAAEVAILDPRDRKTPIGLTITVAGRYSPQGKAAQLTLAEAARADKDETTAAKWAERLLGLIAGCSLAWDAVDSEGAAIPCTEANARALYDEAPWIAEQVQEHYLDTARFFERAKTS